MIYVKRLFKSFYNNNSQVNVLKNVNLTVNSGEFVTITGRSGSGKSTLLNIMGTLLKPDNGEIGILDMIVDFDNQKIINSIRKNYVSFIFQLHHLIPYLNAMENVLLPYSDRFLPINKDLIDKAKSVLDWVGLENKYYRLPGELSGGEQQRVAIARGIIKEPKIIFADEPTGSLDKKTAYNIIELLQLINSRGIVIVMVTHEPDFAKLGNKVYTMEDGQIIN